TRTFSSSWTVEVRHVFREGNKASDFLANPSHGFSLGTHLFPSSNP
ncbi:hypothetical protein LINPERPRIM_LOCUS12166, partial [Linum perenne]